MGHAAGPFSAPRQHLEVGDGTDVDAAMGAEREQIAVPRNRASTAPTTAMART